MDLGFGIFTPVSTVFYAGDIVESVLTGPHKCGVQFLDRIFSFEKSSIKSSKIHTYKATLQKVVDGDTIRVELDLGFGVFHREILRLGKINTAERGTKKGTVATAKLKQILKNVKTLIIKTNKTDIYGRYIADVFLENTEGEYFTIEEYKEKIKIVYRPHPWRMGKDKIFLADHKNIVIDPQVELAYLNNDFIDTKFQPDINYYTSLIKNSESLTCFLISILFLK